MGVLLEVDETSDNFVAEESFFFEEFSEEELGLSGGEGVGVLGWNGGVLEESVAVTFRLCVKTSFSKEFLTKSNNSLSAAKVIYR